MEIQGQIVVWVREIESLKRQVLDHWSMVQKSIADDRVGDAISLLNRYFHLREQLNGTEHRLESALHSHFADK
jgi:hypothetical protein